MMGWPTARPAVLSAFTTVEPAVVDAFGNATTSGSICSTEDFAPENTIVEESPTAKEPRPLRASCRTPSCKRTCPLKELA